MASFILIPGAGGDAWYWHRVAPLIKAAGHDAVAVDLPGDDDSASFADYADRVVAAIGAQRDIVLVAQSLGGFTAPLVCDRVPIQALVFVNAMIPLPGETAGAWWDATGSGPARSEAAQRGGYAEAFDVETYFLHDLPPVIKAQSASHARDQSGAIFADAPRFDAWPEVPIHVIAGAEDRFFPLPFQRRIARDRLGLEVQTVPGGHLAALSYPSELADALIAVATTTNRHA